MTGRFRMTGTAPRLVALKMLPPNWPPKKELLADIGSLRPDIVEVEDR